MAGRRAQTPRSVDRAESIRVDDQRTDRALTALRASVVKLEAARQRAVVVADLAIGVNKVRHGLNRPVLGYHITATTASSAFAHAINTTNPRPELEVWINVVGTAQTAAIIEVF